MSLFEASGSKGLIKCRASASLSKRDTLPDEVCGSPKRSRSVRELISNAVCHRSYLSPGSIQVAIYDDRLEVTSPGRLSPDLTIEHLIEGNSRVRNIAIGAAFQYMHIIERWGSGIPRVFEDARMYGLGDPEIKDFGTSFRISLHRKPFETDPFGVVIPSKEAENEVQHHLMLKNRR